jgi:hypothetical protein
MVAGARWIDVEEVGSGAGPNSTVEGAGWNDAGGATESSGGEPLSALEGLRAPAGKL